MGWQIDTRHMECVHTFAQAEKVWADAKPWKNESDSWRQLAERRAKHKRIVRINNGDAYQCVLYSTPLVTYHRNGDIELQTYNSCSSRFFARCVKPQRFSVGTARGLTYWGYPSQEGDRYVRQNTNPLMLKYVGTGQYNLITEPSKDFEQVLDSKKAAEVRKKLSHYKRWYELTTRMGALPRARRPLYLPKAYIAALLRDPENCENYLDFAEHLGPVELFRREAYEVAGAYTDVHVPYDRLPRRQR